jgi:DMSO/TMAO reductase YedYZ molybdopterin-dependent catalytic subunit
MMKKLLGAAAMAAAALSVAPASAARLEGCSGSNLMKTESQVESMADGDAKWVAFKEVTAAQTALLDGKMSVCAVHLDRAAHAGTIK